MHQNVFIVGATGKVGSTLVHQIYTYGDTDASLHENPTRVVGLASSSYFVLSKKGIRAKTASNFLKNKRGQKYKNLNELLDIAKRQFRDLIFVDVTASNKPMITFHKKIIQKTPFGLVTANKNPLSYSDYKTFLSLTKEPARYGYRCSVMAGADAVPFLRDLRDVRDFPTHIEGCFSGTLGYITSRLEKNVPFSSILKDALQQGYTEPDPRDDLSGLDVARKLLVLARSAGYAVNLSDIVVTPLIPEKYFKKENIETFMHSVKNLDEEFKQKVRDAQKIKSVLRYVASMQIKKGKPQFRVKLQQVPKISQLGNLEGVLNKIIVISKTYAKHKPYSVQAPGAGLDVTAQNIRRDLLYLIESRTVAR